VCGRCGAPLVGDTAPLTVTDATFGDVVERSPLPVLVDMWAPWCGPCRAIAPVIEELAAEMAGRVRFVKLDVDDNPATAARFGVRSIPTLLVLDAGQEVDRIVGVEPKAEIARRLARVLAGRARRPA
jgi:thioredoxin 2